MPRKISLSGIVMATILAVSVVVALTVFGKFRTAQGQVNITSSLTPEQKDAICNPNNPLSKLNPVNTTESKICGIPVTVKPRISNMTSPNTTTGTETETPPSTDLEKLFN
jgi:cell division protein FtsN